MKERTRRGTVTSERDAKCRQRATERKATSKDDAAASRNRDGEDGRTKEVPADLRFHNSTFGPSVQDCRRRWCQECPTGCEGLHGHGILGCIVRNPVGCVRLNNIVLRASERRSIQAHATGVLQPDGELATTRSGYRRFRAAKQDRLNRLHF